MARMCNSRTGLACVGALGSVLAISALVTLTATDACAQAPYRMQILHTIVIDPGHGGDNLGALGFEGVYEKTIVLSIAFALKTDLEKRTNARVILTRNSDKTLSLKQRVDIANTSGATLFISLHANMAYNRDAKGVQVLLLSQEALDNEARKAPNGKVERRGAYAQAESDDAAFVVRDMVQFAGFTDARPVAKHVLESLTKGKKTVSRGTKEGSFGVLKGCEMPAMVVELGFLSNPEEARQLSSQAYQAELARYITDGLIAYDKSSVRNSKNK